MAPNLHPGFWLGVLLFYAGLIVFIVGFACPFWYETKIVNTTGTYEINQGLWYGCVRVTPTGTTLETSSCRHITDDITDEYLKAVEGLQVIALIGFAVTMILKFAIICFPGFRHDFRRTLEITLLTSVIFGLLGVAVFGGACRYVVPWYTTASPRPMSWAFAIDLAGLITLLLAFFVLAFFNKAWRHGDSDRSFRDYGNRGYYDDEAQYPAKYPDYRYENGRQAAAAAGIPMSEWSRKPEYFSTAAYQGPYVSSGAYGPPVAPRVQAIY